MCVWVELLLLQEKTAPFDGFRMWVFAYGACLTYRGHLYFSVDVLTMLILTWRVHINRLDVFFIAFNLLYVEFDADLVVWHNSTYWRKIEVGNTLKSVNLASQNMLARWYVNSNSAWDVYVCWLILNRYIVCFRYAQSVEKARIYRSLWR